MFITLSFVLLLTAFKVYGKPHSRQAIVEYDKMHVVILPAFKDTYMYLIIHKVTNETVAVDPGDADVVIKALEQFGGKLTTILATHFHKHHTAGINTLLKKYPGTHVYGGDTYITNLTKKLRNEDKFQIGPSRPIENILRFECLLTSSHTENCINYVVDSEIQRKIIFTGDTLSVGGIGELIEGNVERLYQDLLHGYAFLPGLTQVYTGHEHTVENLKFARKVEKNNVYVKNKLKWARKKRLRREPTVPSTIEQEFLTNPFVRCLCHPVQDYTGTRDDKYGTLKILYEERYKNHFP